MSPDYVVTNNHKKKSVSKGSKITTNPSQDPIHTLENLTHKNKTKSISIYLIIINPIPNRMGFFYSENSKIKY